MLCGLVRKGIRS